jgi:thiamine-monophosphate kinase
VAGVIGLAGVAVEALSRGAKDPRLAPAIDAYRRPRARIAEGIAGALVAHAGIDVSDGLALDLSRLAQESGVAVLLDEKRVLAAAGDDLAHAAAALALDPLELALHGGEDYALVMTFAPDSVPAPFTRIGRCEPGQGVHLESARAGRREVEPRGFDHFQ